MDDDPMSKFAETFPALYNEIVSYAPCGEGGVYIFLKDGSVKKFQVLKDGVSLERIS